ncbi:unnamed protein product, partial [Aureobasidium pullulans]
MPRNNRGSAALPGALPPLLPVLRHPLPSRLARPPLLPTLLSNNTLLPQPPLHPSRAPAPVFSARWPALLRNGVAVGSSIGHAIGGFFGGGSSAPAEQQAQAPANPADNSTYTSSNYQAPRACETDVTNFRRCMDENQGSLTICGWYLDQLKACQSAALA